MTDILKEVETITRDAMGAVDDYFSENTDAADGERVDRALKLLGAYSRIRATRANEAAISVAVARMMGLRGEALAPVFEALTGQNAAALLPGGSEHSSAASAQAA